MDERPRGVKTPESSGMDNSLLNKTDTDSFLFTASALASVCDGDKLIERPNCDIPKTLENLIQNLTSDQWIPDVFIELDIIRVLKRLAKHDVPLPLIRRQSLSALVLSASNKFIAEAMISSDIFAFCTDLVTNSSYQRDRFTYELVTQLLISLVSAGFAPKVYESGVLTPLLSVFRPYFRPGLEHEREMVGFINTLAKDQKCILALFRTFLSSWPEIPPVLVETGLSFVRDCIDSGQFWLADDLRVTIIAMIKAGPLYEDIIQRNGTLLWFVFKLDYYEIAERYLGCIMFLLSDCLDVANEKHRTAVLSQVPTKRIVEMATQAEPGRHLLGVLRFLANAVVWEPTRVSEMVPMMDAFIPVLHEKFNVMQMVEKREFLRLILNLLYSEDNAMIEKILSSDIAEDVVVLLDGCSDLEAEFALKVLSILKATAEKTESPHVNTFMDLVQEFISASAESDNHAISALALTLTKSGDV